MERSLTGTLKVRPQRKVSHAGNPYSEFIIDVDGVAYKCLAFRAPGERALKELTKTEVKLNVFGKIDQLNSGEVKTLLLNSWGFAEDKVRSKLKKNSEQDSVVTEMYKKMMYDRHQLVYAKVDKTQKAFEPEDDCVQLGKHYVKKIYFILEMLGADVVNNILKQEGVGIKENLQHFTRLKEDMLGLALTDWEQGKRPGWQEQLESSVSTQESQAE